LTERIRLLDRVAGKGTVGSMVMRGNETENIKAVVFDMDGVLVDAREWHYEALNRALAVVGLSISRAEHLFSYDGLPTKKKLELLSAEHGLPVQLHGFLNELKQIYTLELANTLCHPVFQHEYLLARLAREGYRLGVASNSIRASVEAIMGRANLLSMFDVVLSNNDVSAPKPAPDIYLKAAASLGVRPGEMLVVEDNQHGVAAGVAAGARVLEVADPDDVTWERVAGALEGVG